MKILIVAIITIALAIASFLYFSRSQIMNGVDPDFKLSPYQGEALKSFSWRTYGGDTACEELYELTRMEDGYAVLSCTETKGEDVTQSDIVVSEDILDKIAEIADQQGMHGWSSLENSDIVALDAPTTVYHFSYKDSGYSFDDNKLIPQEGWEALNVIRSLVLAEIKN